MFCRSKALFLTSSVFGFSLLATIAASTCYADESPGVTNHPAQAELADQPRSIDAAEDLSAKARAKEQELLEEEVIAPGDYDPLEGFNRAVFGFNDTIDVYFFEPVARGYDYVTPQVVQTGISNFFTNLKTPVYLVSDLVRLDYEQFGIHSARFLVNTTAGVGGFIDVAEYMELEHRHEDFGLALAYHGVPAGPYVVIPILGPSNTRDFLGSIVDTFLNPTFYLGPVFDLDDAEAFAISGGIFLVDAVNTRAQFLQAIEAGKEASLDYYVFVRSSYHQIRKAQILRNLGLEVIEDADAETSSDEGSDTYDDFDDGFDFSEE